MSVACETDESSIQGFGGEIWGKEPLGRPRSNEEDIRVTEINLIEIGCKGVGWTALAHGGKKLASSYEHGIEHSGSIKWVEFLGQLRNYQLQKSKLYSTQLIS